MHTELLQLQTILKNTQKQRFFLKLANKQKCLSDFLRLPVNAAQQTVDTRFLEAAAEFFPQAGTAKPDEFDFKTAPKRDAQSILTARDADRR